MKISRQPKRLAEATEEVRSLLERIAATKNDENLPEVLDHVIEWCWPRGDLFYWTTPLNRFDDILATTVQEYGLERVQTRDFDPKRKKLLVSILRFSRLLIENCTNRKLYNSYDRLNHLLLTSDADVLETTLRLLLRPAQQYSSQGGRSDLPISVSRLSTLSLTWSPQEHGLDMAAVAQEDTVVPSEALGVHFQFYRRDQAPVAGPSRVPDTPGVPTTPVRPPRRDGRPSASRSATSTAHAAPTTPANAPTTASAPERREGLATIDIENVAKDGKTPAELFSSIVQQHHVPDDDQYELFQKIRLASALPNPAARRQMLICRLLAVACYSHIVEESAANTQLFLYEPDIVQKTAALIESQADVNQIVQAAGFYALDGLGRFRSKLGEVLSSISASVNHGTLLRTLRTAIESFPEPKVHFSDHLIDALFGFIAFVTSTQVGSNMIVNAGLVPLLVQLVDTCRSEMYVLQRTVSRAIGLIDSVVYTFPPAFQWFSDVRGLDVFVTRIALEVASDVQIDEARGQIASSDRPEIAEDGSATGSRDNLYGRLSFGKASLLRNLFKSISHMMHTTGTAEGLRGLIDSSLLESIRTIMIHRSLFGPQILGLAINIIAAFIHNEPTSLAIIQEKKLPELFFDVIAEDIEASSDVISAIPNAIGAICLNEAGLKLFNERRDAVVPRLFSIFTSKRHLRVLQDRDTASVVGCAVDELIRHQPSMKQPVLDATLATLDRIAALGCEYQPPVDGDRSRYGLQLVPELSSSTTTVAAADAPSNTSNGTRSLALGDVVMDEADNVRLPKEDAQRQNNDITGFMDIVCRFLDGLFQYTNHCKDFLRSDGPDKLLRFASLPCLPYNFPSSTAADSLVSLLRYMAEVSPNAVVTAILKDIKLAMIQTSAIWNHDADVSSLGGLLAPSNDAALAAANEKFRALVSLNARLHLLSDVLPTLSHGSSKAPAALMQALQAGTASPQLGQVTVAELGELHRTVAWENILLKATAPVPPASSPSEQQGGEQQDTSSPEGSQLASTQRQTSAQDGSDSRQGSSQSASPAEQSPHDPHLDNSSALRYVLSQLPISLTAFFSETTRLLTPSNKRSPDPSSRRTLAQVADSIGKALVGQFSAHSSQNQSNNFAYATTTVGHVTNVLYEDRANAVIVHTAVLVAFERAGGITALVDLYGRYIEELERHFQEVGTEATPNTETPGGKEASLRLGHVCGGVKVVLNLLQNLSAARPLQSSPDTSFLLAQGQNAEGGEVLKTHELLLRLRIAILPALRDTLAKPWLASLPLSVNRSIIQTLLHIIQGDGENAPPKPSAGAGSSSSSRPGLLGPGFTTSGPFSRSGNSLADGLGAMLAGLGAGAGHADGAGFGGFVGARNGSGSGGSGATPGAGPRRHQPVTADESRIQQLIDMGFPRGAARHALVRYHNNANAATEYLLMHPEIVGAMGDEPEPEPPSQSTPAVADAAAPTTTEEAGADPLGAESSTSAAANGEASNSSAPAVEPTSAPEADVREDSPMPPATEAAADQAMQTETSSTAAVDDQQSGPDTAPEGNEAKANAKSPSPPEESPLKGQLDEIRAPITASITDRSLELADKHDLLVFDVKDSVCIFSQDEAKTKATLKSLVESIHSMSSDAFEGKETQSAVRLHLLALVLNDDLVYRSFDDDLARLTSNAVGGLASRYDQRVKEKPVKWLAPLLLVASSVLGREEVPLETSRPKAEEEPRATLDPVKRITQFEAEAHAFFEMCLRCLSSAEKLSSEEHLALYRLLVLLTRDPNIALSLSKRNSIQVLLQPFGTVSSQEKVHQCRSYVVLCLRHIIEASGLLKATIEQEIRAWLMQDHNRPGMELSNFMRHTGSLALRHPEVFLEVIKENAEISEFYPSSGDSENGTILLKLADSVREAMKSGSLNESAPTSPTKGASTEDAAMDDATKRNTRENASANTSANTGVDSVIHLLLSELLMSSKERPQIWTRWSSKQAQVQTDKPEHADRPAEGFVETKTDATSTGTGVESAAVSAAQGDNDEASLDISAFYSCFLMQCLVELTSSYVACKTSFLGCSKKRLSSMVNAGAEGVSPAKSARTPGVMSLFLTELVPNGFLEECSDAREVKRRAAISNWAMSVMVALTTDTCFHPNMKSVSSELISTRKQVLDSLARALRDAAASKDPIEVRYGRLFVLADLCLRVLTYDPHTSGPFDSKPTDDLALHLPKTMLEKGFVNVLTGALSDVDLNLPTVKHLVNALLRPLEHLTRVAIKAQQKGARERRRRGLVGAAAATDADEDNETWSANEHGDDYIDVDGDDNGAEHREETPDFYRSSALGMHTGEMGEPADSMDEDEDDTMDEDEMGEMEYSGDEDHSDLSEEESDSDESDSEEDEDDDMSGGDVEVIDVRDGEGDEIDELAGEDDEEDDEDEDGEDGWTDEDHSDFSHEDNDEDEDGEEEGLDFVLGEPSEGHHGSGNGIGIDAEALLGSDDGDPALGRNVWHAPEGEADLVEEEDMRDGSSMDGGSEEEELDILQDIGLGGPMDNHMIIRQPTSGFAQFGGRNSYLPPSFFLGNGNGTGGPGGGTGGARRHRIREAESGYLPDPASHPLLIDEHRDGSATGSGSRSHRSLLAPSRSSRRTMRRDGTGGSGRQANFHDWAASIQELVGNDARGIFEAIFGHAARPSDSAGQPANAEVATPIPQPPSGDAQISINLGDGTGPARMTIGVPAPQGMAGMGPGNTEALQFHEATLGLARQGSPRRQDGNGGSTDEQTTRPDPVAAIEAFKPLQTRQRWGEEERIIFGALGMEKAARMQNHVAWLLWPRWKETAKNKAEAADKSKHQDQQELVKVSDERDRILDELRAMQDRLAENRQEVADLQSQVDQQQDQAQQQQDQAQQQASSSSDVQASTVDASTTSSQDIEMRERPSATGVTADARPNLELGSLQQGLQELDGNAPGNATAAGSAGDSTGEFSSSTAPVTGAENTSAPRDLFELNGRVVDITDLGIDREVLLALPEEMQEEVIGQALRERRAANVEGSEETNISPEFLEALPPELRAEVLEQEAAERAQRRRETEQTQTGQPAQAAEQSQRDSAAPPTNQGQGQGSTRGAQGTRISIDRSGAIREARPGDVPGQHSMVDPPPGASRLGDLESLLMTSSLNRRGAIRGNAASQGQERSQQLQQQQHPQRDAIQLLDANGIAALIRLLFYPGLDSSSTTLYKVLSNLAQNAKTRHDILTMVLRTLSDASTDTQAVDKSYANVSAKAQGSTPNKPGVRRATSMSSLALQQTPGQSAAAGNVTIAPLSRAGEEAPHLMAIRSLNLLLHLTSINDACAHFFLMETTKKGPISQLTPATPAKGKDKESSQRGSAPLTILLGLLDKSSILTNAQVVDSLIGLLNTVTKHIPTLAAQAEKAAKEAREKAAQAKEKQESANQGAPSSGEPATAPSEASAAVDDPARAVTTTATTSSSAATGQPAADPVASETSTPNIERLSIPSERLACVVRPLSTAISSKGFQHTLAVASHLASIDARSRDAVTGALQKEAEAATKALTVDLDNLLSTLPPAKAIDDAADDSSVGRAHQEHPPTDGAQTNDVIASTGAVAKKERIESSALPVLARPASAQARLLRSLRALEWLLQK